MPFLAKVMHWIIRIATSLIVAGLLWHYRAVFSETTLHNAASAFAGIAATLLGFMVAALSILTAIINQRLLRNMQKTGHYRILLNELYYTGASYALVMIAALFNIFLAAPYVTYGMIVTVSVMTFSTMMMISVGIKFWRLLSNLNPEIKG